MAKSVQPFTWKNGFRQPSSGAPWSTERLHGDSDGDDAYEQSHYVNPPSVEILTSTVHNSLGLNVLRMWPTIYDGTNSPHGIPSWWQPSNEVDVLICGGMSQLTLVVNVS